MMSYNFLIRRLERIKSSTGLYAWLIALMVISAPAAVAQEVEPLWRAHAHNDYERDRPLLEALERGIGSVEVDIHLVDGELLVAHDLDEVKPGRTIQKLYLDPLKAHVEKHNGQVYAGSGSLILLIDVKSEADATYKVLQKILANYKSILTRFEGDTITEGAVTAIISGNRARDMMKAEKVRWAAYDGRLDDLGQEHPESAAFIPLVSSNWSNIVRWYGSGPLPDDARKRLKEAVKQAHAEGRKIRFWATSDNPKVWSELYNAGVDLLNADDLKAVQQFLNDQ